MKFGCSYDYSTYVAKGLSFVFDVLSFPFALIGWVAVKLIERNDK